jgi:hypothetical protein
VDRYGTCAVGIESMDRLNIIYTGNEDVRDIVLDSISQFTWERKVCAKGVFWYQNAGDPRLERAKWGIYHT